MKGCTGEMPATERLDAGTPGQFNVMPRTTPDGCNQAPPRTGRADAGDGTPEGDMLGKGPREQFNVMPRTKPDG